MNYHAWVIGKIKVLQVYSVRICVKTAYTACISQFDFNHKNSKITSIAKTANEVWINLGLWFQTLKKQSILETIRM